LDWSYITRGRRLNIVSEVESKVYISHVEITTIKSRTKVQMIWVIFINPRNVQLGTVAMKRGVDGNAWRA
jgi:hypothetical protein